MTFFDALDLGSGLLSAGLAIKADNRFKTEYPEAYRYHQILGKVCLASPLNFSLTGAEGVVGYASDKLVRGLSQPNFRCFAFVIPSSLSINFLYLPENAIFVIENASSHELTNWINAQLAIGRFFVYRSGRNNIGRDVDQLGYGVEVRCQRIPFDQIEKVLKNVIDDILSFREIYLPIIEPASRLTLSFDAQGNPTGQSASQAMLKSGQALTKRNSIIVPGARERLDYRLVEILKALGYVYEQNIERKYFVIKPPVQGNSDFYIHLFTNPLCHIILQSYSPILPAEQCAVISGSTYLEHTNKNSGGCFLVNHIDRRVVYRTGMDARGLEDSLHQDWILHLIEDHMPEKNFYMLGFQNLKDENDLPSEVLGEFNFATDTPSEVRQAQITPPPMMNQTAYTSERPQPITSHNQASQMYSAANSTGSAAASHPKSRSTTLLLEILPGFIGLSGLGWLYGGNKGAGLIFLIASIVVDVYFLGRNYVSSTLTLFCFIRLAMLGISAFLLNHYTKQHAEMF